MSITGNGKAKRRAARSTMRLAIVLAATAGSVFAQPLPSRGPAPSYDPDFASVGVFTSNNQNNPQMQGGGQICTYIQAFVLALISWKN